MAIIWVGIKRYKSVTTVAKLNIILFQLKIETRVKEINIKEQILVSEVDFNS